ncbi:hypothetical protein [Paracoccus ravus]|uniref:LPD3 domain-containing protein n=1 Tax=Paracoccus ravus TaxID=2447760 RepID=UPI001FD68644|nr:hypothetical protein [Paracoccus ravus]
MRDLGRKAEAWYRKNLVGKTVTNAATGWKIGFNRTGARKIGGRKGEDLTRIVVALEEILTSGNLIDSQPDIMARSNVQSVHRIAARVMLNGQPKDVVATIRQMTDGTFHYDLSKDTGDGAKFSRNCDRAMKASRGSDAQSPVSLNLDFADTDFNGEAIPSDQIRKIADAAAAALKAVGLGRIRAKGAQRRPGVSGSYLRGVSSAFEIAIG